LSLKPTHDSSIKSNLTKRIIPCLDIKDGRTVKGIEFVELRDAGDPIELASRYQDAGADELVFLDITATVENRKTLACLVESISEKLSIPFTVGGGISSLSDAKLILNAGADKVAINSAAVKNPDLITVLAKNLGSQCVVVAVDVRLSSDAYRVFVGGGRYETQLEAIKWCKEVQERGAGEVLLTSMNADGTKSGFDLTINREVSNALSIPVIASGGAGSKEDFLAVFNHTKVEAALAASLFHFNQLTIYELKSFLTRNNVKVRVT
jgi:imidazole glycerol-phosphate synthase subunit HisF